MKSAFRLLFLCAFLEENAISFAQSVSVNLRVTTPPYEVRIGGHAQLKCSFIGPSLGPDTVIEWRNSNKTLVWNGVSYYNNFAASSLTINPNTDVISQNLEISRLKLSDTGTYICNVRSLKDGGGSGVVASDSVFLNVTDSYFPDSYPVCAPSGPHTVSIGSAIPLSCTSEPGRPPVTITISQNMEDVTEMFVAMVTNGNLIRHRDLMVSPEDDGVVFLCSITSPHAFPQLQKTCTIGPFTVLDETGASTVIPTGTFSATTPPLSLGSASPQPPQTTTVIALASTLGVLICVCMIVCVMLSTPVDLFHSKKKPRSSSSTARVHPKPNDYDGQAMNVEIFTTREGVTDFAYAIPDGDTSGSDDYNIPMYSVVATPVGTQIQNTQKDRGVSAIVSDRVRSEVVPDRITPAISSDQERPVTVSAQIRAETTSDRETSAIVSDQEISMTNHETSAGVSHQEGPGSVSRELQSTTPPPPPLPPLHHLHRPKMTTS